MKRIAVFFTRALATSACGEICGVETWRSAAMSLTPEICGAVLNGDLPALESFLSAGGDINALSAVPHGDTLLALAVSVGNIKTIRFLLERGADPNIGGEPIFPLHLARDAQTAELLLANGARVDAQSAHSRSTALALWLELFGSRSTGQDSELILVLLRHGASLDLLDFTGRDVLQIAQARLASYGGEGNRFKSQIPKYESIVNLLTAVRDAGSYKRYLRERAVALLKLRYLCLAGRATAPAHLVRCFGSPPIPTDAARSSLAQLPDEVFEHVLSFWNDT